MLACQQAFDRVVCAEEANLTPDDISKLRAQAKRGLASPQLHLGTCLLYGDEEGIPQDYAEAFELLSKCDQKGVPRARWHLGRMYLLGLGVSRDPERARELLRKASDAGEFLAALDLARLAWSEGHLEDAVSWYTHLTKEFVTGDEVADGMNDLLNEAKDALMLCRLAVAKVGG